MKTALLLRGEQFPQSYSRRVITANEGRVPPCTLFAVAKEDGSVIVPFIGGSNKELRNYMAGDTAEWLCEPLCCIFP